MNGTIELTLPEFNINLFNNLNILIHTFHSSALSGKYHGKLFFYCKENHLFNTIVPLPGEAGHDIDFIQQIVQKELIKFLRKAKEKIPNG